MGVYRRKKKINSICVSHPPICACCQDFICITEGVIIDLVYKSRKKGFNPLTTSRNSTKLRGMVLYPL